MLSKPKVSQSLGAWASPNTDMISSHSVRWPTPDLRYAESLKKRIQIRRRSSRLRRPKRRGENPGRTSRGWVVA